RRRLALVVADRSTPPRRRADGAAAAGVRLSGPVVMRTAWPSAGWPSVGVVIPTRNRPELLARAIAGVVAQDYPGPVRIAVVFDQSDPDQSLVRDGERPLDVLSNLRTPGLAGARNTGIVGLDTELVAFCDD